MEYNTKLPALTGGLMLNRLAWLALGLVLLAQGNLLWLVLGLAVWLGLCAGVGNLQRSFVAYGTMLSGYSAAMVALLDFAHPDQVFALGWDRLFTALTGVFAAQVWGGESGLIDGSAKLFVENIYGVLAAAAYSVVVTFVILKVIDATIGLRVSKDEETEGLDTNLHGEEGYHMGGAGALME